MDLHQRSIVKRVHSIEGSLDHLVCTVDKLSGQFDSYRCKCKRQKKPVATVSRKSTSETYDSRKTCFTDTVVEPIYMEPVDVLVHKEEKYQQN